MNNIYGALGVTVLLLIIIGSTILFRGRAVYEPIMTQSMLHHERSIKRKYVEKINKKVSQKFVKKKKMLGLLLLKMRRTG